jgi:hypothetical protein
MTPSRHPTSRDLDAMVAAGPWPERAGLRLLLEVARRPRGAALLRAMPQLDRAAESLLAMNRYDDPGRARGLGWDAAAVAARGRELRRAEGRRLASERARPRAGR